MEQFYFTSTGSTIFDYHRKISGKFEIKLTRVINGGKPPTPINYILVYFHKNRWMELLKMQNSKSHTGKVKTSPVYPFSRPWVHCHSHGVYFLIKQRLMNTSYHHLELVIRYILESADTMALWGH